MYDALGKLRDWFTRHDSRLSHSRHQATHLVSRSWLLASGTWLAAPERAVYKTQSCGRSPDRRRCPAAGSCGTRLCSVAGSCGTRLCSAEPFAPRPCPTHLPIYSGKVLFCYFFLFRRTWLHQARTTSGSVPPDCVFFACGAEFLVHQTSPPAWGAAVCRSHSLSLLVHSCGGWGAALSSRRPWAASWRSLGTDHFHWRFCGKKVGSEEAEVFWPAARTFHPAESTDVKT